MIRIERLEKSYAGFGLRVDRLEIAEGEYFAVLGPSGAGKTILLSCLAGIVRPDRGRIRFGDREVTALPPESRSAGWVSQGNTLFPHLSVERNIRFARRYLRIDGERFEKRLERLVRLLEIEGLLDRAPNDLSGGEAQRVMLARALVTEPRILLLDEPLRGLDPNTQERLRDELAAIHRELGTTTFHITHDHVEARALADRIAVIHRGRIEQIGEAAEVFERPATVFAARFTGAENVFRLGEDERHGDGDRDESPASKSGPGDGGSDMQRAPSDAADDYDQPPVLDRGLLPGAVADAEATHVSVRPEHVEVRPGDSGEGESPSPSRNEETLVLSGRIESIAPRGPWLRVSVQSDTGRWIALVPPRETARSALAPGQPATVSVTARYLHTFHDPAVL